jgi:hypothetical protein
MMFEMQLESIFTIQFCSCTLFYDFPVTWMCLKQDFVLVYVCLYNLHYTAFLLIFFK